MAFATKIVNREVELDSCKPLLKPENAKAYAKLKDLLKPAVKEVTVGTGDTAKNAVKTTAWHLPQKLSTVK